MTLFTDVVTMFTLRTMGGLALLLAGSSWLWITPTFATRGVNTSSIWWNITRRGMSSFTS